MLGVPVRIDQLVEREGAIGRQRRGGLCLAVGRKVAPHAAENLGVQAGKLRLGVGAQRLGQAVGDALARVVDRVQPTAPGVHGGGEPELQAVLDDAAKLALHRAQVGLAQILDLPDQVGSVELGVRPELGQAPQLARLIARPGIEVLAVQVLHATRHRSFH